MKRGRKLHTQHDDAIRAAAEGGSSIAQTAAQLGIPGWKVRLAAKRLGIVFRQAARGRQFDTNEDGRVRDALASMTLAGAAAALGLPYWKVARIARRLELKPDRPTRGVSDCSRLAQMDALYRAGRTLQQIGDQYGVSRERVRQLLRKYTETSAADGGRRRAAAEKKAAHATVRDMECMERCGCTFEQYKHLRQIGRDMVAAGAGAYQTPLRAFATQRNNANHRGIGWELNVWQWWSIWQASGKWDQRGRAAGDYVMCRKGDVGPYSLGNVFIAPANKNISDANNRSGLPIGVKKCKSGRYGASRQVKGKRVYLGVFASAEIAHAAYLAALNSSSAEAA